MRRPGRSPGSRCLGVVPQALRALGKPGIADSLCAEPHCPCIRRPDDVGHGGCALLPGCHLGLVGGAPARLGGTRALQRPSRGGPLRLEDVGRAHPSGDGGPPGRPPGRRRAPPVLDWRLEGKTLVPGTAGARPLDGVRGARGRGRCGGLVFLRFPFLGLPRSRGCRPIPISVAVRARRARPPGGRAVAWSGPGPVRAHSGGTDGSRGLGKSVEL